MEPTIWDVNGTQRDWTWLHNKYGRLEHLRGTGYPRFELARIEETVGPSSMKVKLIDDKGAPLGALCVLTYPDLGNPASFLQDLTTGDPAKSQWSRRGAVQFTDGSTGLTGFGLGSDSWIKDKAAGGPYHVWVFHTAFASDCLSWIGWLGGTDHGGPCSLTFRLVKSGGVDPEPVPDDDFKAEVTESLATIVALLSELNEHLGVP